MRKLTEKKGSYVRLTGTAPTKKESYSGKSSWQARLKSWIHWNIEDQTNKDLAADIQSAINLIDKLEAELSYIDSIGKTTGNR